MSVKARKAAAKTHRIDSSNPGFPCMRYSTYSSRGPIEQPHTYSDRLPRHVTRTHLVICAIGAGHKLSELLVGREPCLEVVLLDRGIVELARHDIHDAIGEPKALVKLLRSFVL